MDGVCAWGTPQALLDSTPQGGPPTEGHGQPASLGGGPGTHRRGGRTRPGEGVLQCQTCKCAGHPRGPRVVFCLPTPTGRAPGVSAQPLWPVPLQTEPFQGVGLATGTEHICSSERKCGVAERGGRCLFRQTGQDSVEGPGAGPGGWVHSTGGPDGRLVEAELGRGYEASGG